MKDELISFETAVLAKEKGFNLKVLNYYVENYRAGDDFILISDIGDLLQVGGNIHDPYEDHNNVNYIFKRYSVPTQSLLQRWLREVHGLHVSPELQWYRDVEIGWYASIEEISTIKWIYDGGDCFNTYEKALEKGLLEALKLIKQ